MQREFRALKPRDFLLTIAALALAWTAPAALAQQSGKAWTPPPPAEMPDKLDWVQVPSGEWLGGEIKVLYEDSLEFDSDEVGILKIDWQDVVELRSTRVLEVRPEVGESATGKVLVKDGKVTIMTAPPVTFDQADILAITAGVPRERNFWTGEVSGSANYQSGNTDKEEFNGRIIAKRRTVEQRMVFEYIGNYDKNDGTETENNHRLTGDWARYITSRWFWTPLTGEYFKDKFQNIEHRTTLGTGIGYEIFDTSTTEWRVSGGPAYTKTWFEEVPAGESDSEDSFALQGKSRFDHELTDNIDIWWDYRLLWANEDTGGYTHRMEFGTSYDIIGDLDLRVSYIWDYISEPAEDNNGEKPDESDTQILIGIGYTF